MLDDLFELDNDTVERAYENLSEQDKAVIGKLAEKLEQKVKSIRGDSFSKHGPTMFGKKQALELIAKLGIWYNANVKM
jgi:hypothetical protein